MKFNSLRVLTQHYELILNQKFFIKHIFKIYYLLIEKIKDITPNSRYSVSRYSEFLVIVNKTQLP